MLLGEQLPQLIQHVLISAQIQNRDEVQKILCETRQSWNGIFSSEVLRAIDETVKEVYEYWPITYKHRQLIVQLDEVKMQLTIMQKEVDILEMQANETTFSIFNAYEMPQQQEQYNQASSSMHRRNGCNRPKLEEIPLPKRSKCVAVSNLLLSQSSVLLTPSPEPQNRLSPPPSSSDSNTINEKSNSSSSNFWMSMMKIEEQQQQLPRLSISMLDENIKMPFLFESFEKPTC